jgi:hypothetical protein
MTVSLVSHFLRELQYMPAENNFSWKYHCNSQELPQTSRNVTDSNTWAILVCNVLFCLSYSVYHFMPSLICLSCGSACPAVLPVLLFCLSCCSTCPAVLPVLLFCCPVKFVLFCVSRCACPGLSVLYYVCPPICLSYSACPSCLGYPGCMNCVVLVQMLTNFCCPQLNM